MSERILVTLPTDEDDQEDYLNLSADNPYSEFRCPAHGASAAIRVAIIWCSNFPGHDRDAIWSRLRPWYEDFLAGGRRVTFIYHPPFDPHGEWQRICNLQPLLRPGSHKTFSRWDIDPYFATLRQLEAASTCSEFASACNTLRNALQIGNDLLDLCGSQRDQELTGNLISAHVSTSQSSTQERLRLWRHTALQWRSGFALAQEGRLGGPRAAARLAEEINWVKQQPREAPILRAEADLASIAASAGKFGAQQKAILSAALGSLYKAAGLFRDLLDRNPQKLEDWAACFQQIDRLATDCDNMLSELTSDAPRANLISPTTT